jgi:hypothetical protein
MVTLIDATIEAIVEGRNAQRTILGQSYTRHNIGELITLRDYYQTRVNATTTGGGVRTRAVMSGLDAL